MVRCVRVMVPLPRVYGEDGHGPSSRSQERAKYADALGGRRPPRATVLLALWVKQEQDANRKGLAPELFGAYDSKGAEEK